MTDCCCGNPEGDNDECERCRLIARIKTLKSKFDESNDGADRAAAFLESLVALMKEHHVKVNGALRECCFEHQFGERENWWQLDMYEVHTLTDGKAR
ncbi:MAG: hypothetical protein EHM64_17340 [Ignavibacteriae bacterium]|nr:MAG: hypothetical protein EHM64_17340 [Ignavibacteriota bacterium]